MSDRLVSRAEIAERLGLTERQITRLVRLRLSDGTEFPSRVEGRARRFYSDRCFRWYLTWKVEEALQREAQRGPKANLAEVELRKATADAMLAEHKLQVLRKEYVPISAYTVELRRVLDRVNATLSAAPGEYGPRLLNITDVRIAVERLREIVRNIKIELQRAGRYEGDPDDESDDLDDEAA